MNIPYLRAVLLEYLSQRTKAGSLSTESETIILKYAKKCLTQMKNVASILKYIDFAYYKPEHMALLTAPRH